MIASLQDDLIQLDKCFDGCDGAASCLMLVDEIDCMIDEPHHFDMKWFSQNLMALE